MARLPDFLIIGGYKCGTTSLLNYLGQHPRIYLPWLQEPNFFSSGVDAKTHRSSKRPEMDRHGVYRRHRARTLEQYVSLFQDSPPDAVMGECSPEYLRSPRASSAIRSMLPNARLIAILRDPAERAFSDYQAFVRDGLEHDTFENAIRRTPGAGPGHQYVYSGFYAAQLRPYLALFPRDQIKVFLFEDLAKHGARVLQETFAWLGVDPSFQPDIGIVRNVSGRPRNAAVATAYRIRRRARPWLKPLVPSAVQRPVDAILTRGLLRGHISPEARAELVRTYRTDILELEQILGRDLSDWLETEQS